MKIFLAFFLALPGSPRRGNRRLSALSSASEHYAVTGSTGIELYRSIGENGPSVGIGRAIAYTDFDLLWSRDYRPQSDGSCVLASAVPSLTITYHLPRCARFPAAHTQRLWDVFIAGVEKHERVHGEILLDMTRQIEAVSVGLSRRQRTPAARRCAPNCSVNWWRSPRSGMRGTVNSTASELSEGGTVHQLVLALVNG